MKNLIGVLIGFVAIPMFMATQSVAQSEVDIAQYEAEFAKISCNIAIYEKNVASSYCDNQRDGNHERSSIQYMISIARAQMSISQSWTVAQRDEWEAELLADLAILDTERSRIFDEDENPLSYEYADAQSQYDLAWWGYYYTTQALINLYNDAADKWNTARVGYEDVKDQYNVLGYAYQLMYIEAYTTAVEHGYTGNP